MPKNPDKTSPYSERTLRLCVEHAPVAIAMFDREMRYLAVSQRWLASHHVDNERVIGRLHDEVIPDLSNHLKEALRRALAGETIESENDRFVKPDGSVQWLRWEIRPWLLEADQVGGVIIFTEDITQRKQTEQDLHESRDRLRAVVDTAVEAIITIDRRGTVESFNIAAERMFGYAAAEVIGKNVSMLMPSPYREEHDGYLTRYLTTGEARIIGIGREVVAQRKDGTKFPIGLAVSEINHMHIFTGIIRDLSLQKEAEERLRQADRLSSIGTLAAGLGHDMNNILLPVRARLDVIEQAKLPDEIREHFIELRQSATYLQNLADGLHLLALDPNDPNASSETTDINAWWQQTSSLLGRVLPRHVRFSTSLPSTLPRIAVPPHQLTQAVLNMLVNSAKAVDEEGKVRLWAKKADDGEVVELGVRDDGSGMTEEVRRRALEPFFTTKTRGLGTGLGLSLVHGVVNAAGGTIEIQSELDKGTTILLRFPAVSTKADFRDVASKGVDDSHTTSKRVARMTLADPRLRSLVATLLELNGYDISDKHNGDLEENKCDLWITDTLSESPTENEKASARIILLGQPQSETAQRNDRLTIIYNPNDFAAIRTVIQSIAEGADA